VLIIDQVYHARHENEKALAKARAFCFLSLA